MNPEMNMDLKQQLREIVDFIKKDVGKTQQEIAIEMGYKKNYISEMLSPKGEVTAKFLKSLQLRFSDVLSKGKPEPKATHTINRGETLADYKIKGKTHIITNPQYISNEEIANHIKAYPSDAIYVEAKDLTASYERLLDEKEARRKEAMALAEKMERHYEDMKAVVEKNLNIIISSLTQTRDLVSPIVEKIEELKDQTYIVSSQLEHQREALQLGYPKQSKEQPAPFVKKGKAAGVSQQEGGKKGTGR